MCLLSVCIPTMNRPKELENTLNALLKQIDVGKFYDEVQIVVSDNTDNELLLIDASKLSNENIKYIRQRKNVGYARNINNLILEADGEYVWLLSDDDFVLDTAVLNILLNLKANKNINYLTFFTGAASKGKVFGYNLYFDSIVDTVFVKGVDFLTQYWLSVVFVSSNVFNRKKMIEYASKHNLFVDINDVYQNSLLCIGFIDKVGSVKVIPETLLIDNYGAKAYSRHTAIDVPLYQYLKLFYQLKMLGVSNAVLRKIRKAVESNIFYHGSLFLLSYVERISDFDYGYEFKRILDNPKLNISTRLKAGFFYVLFRLDRRLSRFFLRLIFLSKLRNLNYEKEKVNSLNFEKALNEEKRRTSYAV